MRTHTKFLIAPATAAVLVLALAACGDDDGDTDGRQSTGDPSSVTDTATDASTEAGAVDSALAAISAAEEATGGTAYEISEEDGGWEIDVAVGDRSHEVRLGADGAVISSDDDGNLDRDDREGLAAARISIVDAIEAAVGTEPAGRLDDVSLERERNGHVWEVTFDDGNVDNEIHVDVVTGEVVRTGVDD
ncbi:PepSY domain-containing protein [Nocardioides alcanivorans]|uniref:PepSY domain-containing protein n=1 Tax=Nocardioides alcanivorans TaxID=2897352 RepID=UPI001F1E7EE5|nr:PepSY domain-containing protein [Nocardioides alcanivorans]